MRVRGAKFSEFRRFRELSIEGLSPDTRLVVLAGPNGLGKSTVFEGFRAWQGRWYGMNWDPDYFVRVGAGALAVTGPQQVEVEFHDGDVTPDMERIRKAFYFRTAYRIEADFSAAGGVPQMGALVSDPRFTRMSETDATVSQNYNRIIEEAVRELFDETKVQSTEEIRRQLLSDVTESMKNIFGELEVENISDPLGGGSFYFSKKGNRRWHYKNLSGGERAAFDLLLDMSVKKRGYDDTVFCIDEPELHLNTRVQGALLVELMRLLPESCQLWVASHSIGMMNQAKRRSESNGDVAFLDFESFDPDLPSQVMRPAVVDRSFWQRILKVALADLADLMAPRTLVLVEGQPAWSTTGAKRRANVAFDAKCYEKIFSVQRPDAVFMSVGSSSNVEDDTFHLTETTPILSSATDVVRVIDRDDRSDSQRAEYREDGVRVLRRRDLENYLLGDGVIRSYCTKLGRLDEAEKIIEEKARLLALYATTSGNSDDVKAISGELYTRMTTGLGLSQQGTKHAWMKDTLAPLLKPGLHEYDELDEDIFGDYRVVE